MNPEILSWEQQPGETPRQYQAFLIYRDLGPDRTYMNAFRAYSVHIGRATEATKSQIKTPSQWIYQASTQFHWKERAQAWDRAQERAGMEARADEVRKAIERHAAQARAIQTAAIRRFQALQNEAGDAGISQKALKELAEVFEKAMRMERLAMGLSETVAEERQKPASKSPFETFLEEHGERLYVMEQNSVEETE